MRLVSSESSDELLLQQIRERGNTLLAGLTRDADSLRGAKDPCSNSDGAALWDRAAADVRAILAELQSETEIERPQS